VYQSTAAMPRSRGTEQGGAPPRPAGVRPCCELKITPDCQGGCCGAGRCLLDGQLRAAERCRRAGAVAQAGDVSWPAWGAPAPPPRHGTGNALHRTTSGLTWPRLHCRKGHGCCCWAAEGVVAVLGAAVLGECSRCAGDGRWGSRNAAEILRAPGMVRTGCPAHAAGPTPEGQPVCLSPLPFQAHSVAFRPARRPSPAAQSRQPWQRQR
jgi:hypothetical protein